MSDDGYVEAYPNGDNYPDVPQGALEQLKKVHPKAYTMDNNHDWNFDSAESSRRFASELAKWEPGQYGCWMEDSEGKVHTWQGGTFHRDYARAHGITMLGGGYITPEGKVQGAFADNLEQIVDQIPGAYLTSDQEDKWGFESAESANLAKVVEVTTPEGYFNDLG